MAYGTAKGRYYKDNPQTKRKRNERRMWVNGEYIPNEHPLHKPGRYNSWQDAWDNKTIDKVKVGWVYLIGNPAWPDWIKIGKAISAEDRLNGYQTSSPHRDYYIIYKRQFDDHDEAESCIHEELMGRGVMCNCEWFFISHEDAIHALDTLDLTNRQKDLFDATSS